MASPEIMWAYEMALAEKAMELNHCGYMDVTESMLCEAEKSLYADWIEE